MTKFAVENLEKTRVWNTFWISLSLCWFHCFYSDSSVFVLCLWRVLRWWYVDGSIHRWLTPKVHGQPVPEFSCLATWPSLVWKNNPEGLYHEVLNFLRMTPLLARDPTSDACFFNALVMCDGGGFRLRTVKAMACGSVVQSAHVPIYEQLLSRNDFRHFLGACNAGFVEFGCNGSEELQVVGGVGVSNGFLSNVVLTQVISRPWHQARLKKCRKVGFRWSISTVPASFGRSLGIKFTGRLLAELNLIDRQLSVQTFSIGESQGLWSRNPLVYLSCTALETRTGIMIWQSLHDSCWLKSEHNFCNRTAAHQNADVFFFCSKTFKCQWFQWQVIQGMIAQTREYSATWKSILPAPCFVLRTTSGSWSRKSELVPLQYLDSNLRNLTTVIKSLPFNKSVLKILEISGFHLQSELREAKDAVTGDLLGSVGRLLNYLATL